MKKPVPGLVGGWAVFLSAFCFYLSSMRILLAALLGPIVVGEFPLNATGWVEALLLFGANAVPAMRRGRVSSARIN
ncbi:MAG: hypothetical protein GY850_17640 [bacterium]|nr:hypothetical protein [bacterium]